MVKKKALTYEANVTNFLLKNMSNDLNNDITLMMTSLDNINKQHEQNALEKNQKRMTLINKSKKDTKKKYIQRKKLAIIDTKKAILNEQNLIAHIKKNLNIAINMGYNFKEEIINFVTQIIEYNTTNNEEHKNKIKNNIPLIAQMRILKKDNNKSGYINIIILLVISFLILGVAFISWKVVI